MLWWLCESCTCPRGIQHHFYHALQELSQNILSDLESQKQLYRPLICEKSKPVPLKLFTPRLVKV